MKNLYIVATIILVNNKQVKTVSRALEILATVPNMIKLEGNLSLVEDERMCFLLSDDKADKNRGLL